MDYIQEVLENINNCDTKCVDLGSRPCAPKDGKTSVEWYMENMPGAQYVLDRQLNYIFANGMTTGEEEADRRLSAWLYERKNRTGATNYAELRQSIGLTITHGECGIRHYNGDIYHLPKGYYGVLLDREDGLDEIVAYYVRKDRRKVAETLDKDSWGRFQSYEDIWKWFDDKGYILLDTADFMMLRNDDTALNARSPFEKDKQRVDLLKGVYKQLNYDIRYDGPGRTFFFTKSGYAEGNENDISTGTVLNNTDGAKEVRLKKAKKEIEQLLTQIKKSTSDSVGVLSGAFDPEHYIHLPRVTKGTDFLSWLDIDTVVMAQLFGMSPTLLEVGELHGNVSVEKIIDNAMLNTIVPMREKYATQFSEFIGRIVGVPKVYFDKYDMQQIKDENEARLKLAQVIKDLGNANHNYETDNIGNLMNEVADMLRSSLYDDANEMRKM